MSLIIIFILGLIVGSFLNVVIFRLHSEESFLFGRSHCNSCKKELQAKDLVPLFSFIMLRGRCRYCKAKLSWQYPIVELITATTLTLFVLDSGFMILDSSFWYQLIMACFLIVIAVFDFKHYLILDKVVAPALILVIAWNIFSSNFLSGLEGGILTAGFFGLQYLFSHGKWIGFGDVKLGFLLGNLALWPQILMLLIIAYFVGAIVGLALIALGRKHLSSRLPFGVFLGFSAIIVMLVGEPLMNWYLRLIGL